MKHLLPLQLPVLSHVVEGRPILWASSLLESQSISAAIFLTVITCLDNFTAEVVSLVTI